MSDIELIIYSFLASFGFAVTFQIRGIDLIWAGIGGALTRFIFLLSMNVFHERFVYVLISAAFAALYAEIVAQVKKTPSTMFLYPSIIPLIPGDLLYNAIIGLQQNKEEIIFENAVGCLLALLGLSVGFVLVSTVAHYIRKSKWIIRR